MDSGSQAAVESVNGRSGGKVFKRRQIVAKKTPYDRPTLPLRHENLNWFNALIFPVKFVAGGASKVLSSFWNPKKCVIEDDYELHDANLHDGGTEPSQNKGSSSGKSEILYLVEQLLMLECFSREECDRLIKIINLRDVDHVMKEGVDAGSFNPNISNKVVMEAREMITQNPVGSSLKSDSNSLVTLNMPHRDYLSGGSWNIQNEVQKSHSKAIVLIKPSKPLSLEAPKPDYRATQDDVPTEALPSLPIIKEKYQIEEEKDFKDDKAGDEGNCDMITEYAEVADVIHASQGSSNTNDPSSIYSPTVKQGTTRTRKYNTRRGRPRGK
ncbi:hypothetical protein E3N88_27164 [Mikania micrantha]|uniref:Uncharacterized protein n=1 Tax=Mikania micrantha TaxID=192012 RepID=A0A5N6MVW1_9ASTR|nr:hypothetical protein E3N88_27164 [Mikania micrantha]